MGSVIEAIAPSEIPADAKSIFTLEPTEDRDLIQKIITDPKVYDRFRDDTAPARSEFQPQMDPRMKYVLLKRDGELLGLFAAWPHSSTLWEASSFLLPRAWGSTAAAAFKEFSAWIWRNTPCLRLIVSIAEGNSIERRFATSSGLEQWGVNPKAFLRRGKLHDIYMFGVSRPEGACQ